MVKTSYDNMKKLGKKLQKQLKKFEDGNMSVDELEAFVNDAQELYERLVILKYKAYEKYGSPDENVAEEPQEIVEKEVVADVLEEEVVEQLDEEVVVEEEAVEIVEEVEEEASEQPSFDFSMSEEVSGGASVEKEEETFPESAETKTEAPKDELEDEPEEEAETFPESEDIKSDSSDSFQDSHVEKHEPEDENSLNQKLSEEKELSLRKKLQGSKVEDLKSEISIAKKFEYITFMFDGNNELYDEAIVALNNCADVEEAKEKLNAYSTQYNWDLENKSIIKFVELVERRYI